MEAKPIVTSHGNQSVLSMLQKPLLESLPKEPAEWRRSYGRPARNVQLEASFVPYDDDILPDDSVKTLVSRLYFHIFWTDCDLETYKVKVKEEITEWCAALKAKNISDWMIVILNSDETKNKTKLLPRTSVYDKIKSDFCSKQPERIVVLESLNGDQKSVSLWNTFVSRLRQLLLQAFTRHLQKYEDNMRALRERRNEVGWNFQEYFIVQEELAFMFEMLGLHEDAMIQYDELDALFTQFILNHASGQYVPWLKSLTEPCKVWAGLSLQKPIAWEKRNLIKDNKATLLDFRNYLFSRQCAILLLLKRPAEIIQRAIDYLHETVQEMKTLEIEITEGGLDCWVYLSGLEVLQKCEKLIDEVNPRGQALNTAYLGDYVCRKLNKLGELCGLMPGDKNSPSSEQLALVIDLTSGMGLEVPEDAEELDSHRMLPRDKLREALSSREAFQRIYLEQSELAMGTFKHIGRFRSARMIGKNLADFYMKLGEPQKAENFLLDAMTSYHLEGWKKLRDVARLDLARCQHQVAVPNKYIKTACQVASCGSLQLEDRKFHMEQVLKLARDTTALLKASPLLKINVTDISKTKVTVDEPFTITMEIENTGPCDISCDTIWLTLADCAPNACFGAGDGLGKFKLPVARQTSNSSLENRVVMNVKRVKKQSPAQIDLCLHYEGSLTDLVSSGIACTNSHEVLKRNDSSGGMLAQPPANEKVKKDTTNQSVSLNNVLLKPGKNTVLLMCEGIVSGDYEPGQAGVKVSQIEFIKDMTSDLTVSVTCDETFCEVKPENLVAGTKQEVTVCLHAGNIPIDAGSKVKVMSSDKLAIDTSYPDSTVSLSEVARGNAVDWKMVLFQEPDIDGDFTIDNKIAFDCSWLPRPLISTLTFQNPFRISHRLHTAREMKYIQIVVDGQCRTMFALKDWTLSTNGNKDVDLVSLNKIGNELKVNAEQNCSLMWQVKSNIHELPPLDLTFAVTYSCTEQTNEEPRQLQYHFSLAEFQTLYTVKAEVIPSGENKVCKTGSLSVLRIHILQMPVSKPLADQNLMYEVQGQSNWSISGKSIGVFSITGGNFSTSVEVVPVCAGFLPLPKIRLFRYTGVKKEGEEQEKDNVLDSTDEESSDSENTMNSDHLDFNQGQVYYSSMGKQVQVYPVDTTGEVEVTIA